MIDDKTYVCDASQPFARRTSSKAAKAGAFALAAALGMMSVPVQAFASYLPQTGSGKAVMSSTGDSWDNQLKKLGVAKNADGTKTASYTGIAHSDLIHYSAYGLTTQVTFDSKGTVTAINLTSGNETFAGAWGYKNVGKQVAAIDGYLPDGCSLDVTGNRKDGFTPTIASKTGLSTSFAGLAYYSVDASGKATAVTPKTTTSASGDNSGGKARPGAAATTYDDWDYKSGKLTVSDDSVNVVCVTFSIGAESAIKFNTYFCIAQDGAVDADSTSAANKYLDTLAATTWDTTPVLAGTMAETNRDKWTLVMATVNLQRQLLSWSASIKSDFEAAGEVSDLDTISGATKTSEPFVAALNQAYTDGYIKSVADNVKLTIDGGTSNVIDVNANPADRSSVSKDSSGNYVLTNVFPYGEDRAEAHGTTLDTIETYAIEGDVSTAEIAKIAKGRSDYQPLNTYSPKTVIGYEEDDGDPIYSQGWPDFKDLSGDIDVDYDASDGTAPIKVTVNNKKITHLALTYTIGHGTITVVYDLKQMEAATKVTAQIKSMKASNAKQVAAARKAYNALSTDVRGFVTNIDKLVKAEESAAVAVTPASKSFKASVLKKSAKSFTVKVKGSTATASFSVAKSSKKVLSVTKKGKVTVKKGAKKGSYKLSVKVGSVSKTITVKVK